MKATNILDAIHLANVIRNVGDHELVDDLVPGKIGNSQSCVLANTFNCECNVSPIDGDIAFFISGFPFINTDLKKFLVDEYGHYWESEAWGVYFKEEKYAKALADQLGINPIKTRRCLSEEDFVMGIRQECYCVLLPKHVAQIASDFDDGLLDEYNITKIQKD